jgi:hypothetical protein
MRQLRDGSGFGFLVLMLIRHRGNVNAFHVKLLSYGLGSILRSHKYLCCDPTNFKHKYVIWRLHFTKNGLLINFYLLHQSTSGNIVTNVHEYSLPTYPTERIKNTNSTEQNVRKN